MASIRERAAKMLANINERSSTGNTSFWAPHVVKSVDDPGDRIRLIVPPYLGEDADPWIESRQYSLPVPGQRKPHMTDAPSFFGLPDPVEDMANALRATGNKDDREKAGALWGKTIYRCLIYDYAQPEKGVQVATFGTTVMKALIGYLLDEDYNPFFDSDAGHDIKIKRTGEGLETKYEVHLSPKPTPLPNKDALLAAAAEIDLTRFIVCETPETLCEIMEGRYDKEEAKKRRKERDAELHPPLPPYVVRGDADEEREAVVTRKAIREEEAKVESMDDLAFGPAKPKTAAKPAPAPKDEIPYTLDDEEDPGDDVSLPGDEPVEDEDEGGPVMVPPPAEFPMHAEVEFTSVNPDGVEEVTRGKVTGGEMCEGELLVCVETADGWAYAVDPGCLRKVVAKPVVVPAKRTVSGQSALDRARKLKGGR